MEFLLPLTEVTSSFIPRSSQNRATVLSPTGMDLLLFQHLRQPSSWPGFESFSSSLLQTTARTLKSRVRQWILPLVQPPCQDLASPSERSGWRGWGVAAPRPQPQPQARPAPPPPQPWLSSRPRTLAPGRAKLQAPARDRRRSAAHSCPPR